MSLSQQMQRANSELSQSKSEPLDAPKNYFSKLTIPFGFGFGILGSLAIMAIIAVLTINSSQGIWLSPRIIASVFLGEAAATGPLPILLGTMIHLAMGAIYGGIFAWLLPRMPRPLWIVAGLLFGVAIWGIAILVLPPLIDTIDVREPIYFYVLLFSHLVFGVILGLGGAFQNVTASDGS